MKKIIIVAVTISLFVVWFSTIQAQVVENPTYQPREWWEVSIKTQNATDHEPFYRIDGEYRIEADQSGFQCLYKDAGTWTDNCAGAKEFILNALLGIGEEKYLKFPITTANRWKYSFRDSGGREFSGESVVGQSEKITLAGKTVGAYRVKREGEWMVSGRRRQFSGPLSVIYWYAPDCKCVPKLKLESGGHSYSNAAAEMTLTNFKVSK